MKNIRRAFTLAELLIAMMIFAMLAVILIPNVTNNAEKELFATQLKKVQNDIQQALLFIKSQNQGSLQFFCSGSVADASKCFIGLKNVASESKNGIAKKLEYNVIYDNNDSDNNDSVNNVCNGNTVNRTDKKNAQAQACAYIERNPIYLNKDACNLSVHNTNSFYAVNLKNGATVSVFFDPTCTFNNIPDATLKNWENVVIDAASKKQKICGYMEVDVNGGKVPNMVGKDIHYFWIDMQDGLIPFGEFGEFTCGNTNANGGYTSKSDWPTKTGGQLGCTYRMLQKNSPDYF